MSRADIARSLAWIAEDLELNIGYPYAGIIRRTAQMIATAPDIDADGCHNCGGALPEGRTKWCGESCRRKRRS